MPGPAREPDRIDDRDRVAYDVVVIGGGHAGTEAAWAAASALGETGRVALVTMDPARIGAMSCNPAIGGLAKGHIVREIDALGGLMARAADATGILFKVLNASRGAAVQGPRSQNDTHSYLAEVQRLIATRRSIDVIAGTVDSFDIERAGDRRFVRGVHLAAGSGVVHADPAAIERNVRDEAIAIAPYPSRSERPFARPVRLDTGAVVLTTGTFMRALMHTGDVREAGGRVGEGSATGIGATLESLGFELGRLKTGTPPRLARASIDWDALEVQAGDDVPRPFSDLSPEVMPAGRFPHVRQLECRITHTVARAHELIRANLHRAPMYTGEIDAECGPRYCPSIEDKVVRFADRDSHQVFLEPESRHTDWIYANGISTSLPVEVQRDLVRAMPGCHHAEILRAGYAVEYDVVWPHQIRATGETRLISGLWLAGQINGTSGYEEAAAQGLVAGVNAARRVRGEDGVVLGRDQAYIGVLMDDLVTRTPREPYRMFTSRAEHRLLLRADNADERLTPLGRTWGLVGERRWRAWESRVAQLDSIRARMDARRERGRTLTEIARRQDETVETIAGRLDAAIVDEVGATRDELAAPVDRRLVERAIVDARYAGYVVRQRAEVRRQARKERVPIPDSFDPDAVAGLRTEARDVLRRFRPATLGQAGRLAGVNPADLVLVSVAIERDRRSS